MDVWGFNDWSMSENGVQSRDHVSGVTVVIRNGAHRFVTEPSWEYLVFPPTGSDPWRRGFLAKDRFGVDAVQEYAMSHAMNAVDAHVPVQGPFCEGCKNEPREDGLTGCVGDWTGRVSHLKCVTVGSYLD